MAEPRINENKPADQEQWNLRALREPTMLLTATYLATSAIGLWASYCFYKPFGIAVLDYMQPADFLVAALHDPMYFLVVLAGAFLSWLGSRIDAYRERRPHRVEAIREKTWWGLIVFPHGSDPHGRLLPDRRMPLWTIVSPGTATTGVWWRDACNESSRQRHPA